MSNDNGLGHILIAFRELALSRDPDFEKDIDAAALEARRQLEADWQRAKRENGLFGGQYLRYICDNNFRVKQYVQDGGQLELITPQEAREFLARSREQTG